MECRMELGSERTASKTLQMVTDSTMAGHADFDKFYDVVILGGGNAALCGVGENLKGNQRGGKLSIGPFLGGCPRGPETNFPKS